MMKKRNRVLSVMMAMALVLSLTLGTGMTAFAQEEEDPVCAHEAGVHNQACGFAAATEGAACANAEADPDCAHEGDCGYVAAGPGQPCEHAEHDDDCGGVVVPQAEDEPPAVAGTITGFELAEINVEPGTPESGIAFPAEVTATVQPDAEGAQPATVKVGVSGWRIAHGDYTPGVAGWYDFQADEETLALPDGVALGVNETGETALPMARVVVGAVEEAEAAPMAGGTIPGTTLTWDLTGTVLTIGGTGAMPTGWTGQADQPWGSSRTSITSVIIGDGITGISPYAFRNCTSLSSITIPANVTVIGNFSFSNCSALNAITFLAQNPPTISGTSVFSGVAASGQITVPAGTVVAYTTALTGRGLTIGASDWTITEGSSGNTQDYTLYYNDGDGLMYKEAGFTNEVPASDYSGSYTGDGSTLTLEDFSFSTTANPALYLPSATTIELSGDSAIESTAVGTGDHYGISIPNALITVKNKADTSGTLTVKAGESTDSTSYGISCNNFRLESGAVSATAPGASFGSFGVSVGVDLIVNGGTLTAEGGTAQYSNGVVVNSDVALNGGTIIAQSVATSGVAAAIYFAGEPTGSYTAKGGASSSDNFDLERVSSGFYVLVSDNASIAKYAELTAVNDFTLYYSATTGKMYKEATFDNEVPASDYTGSYTGDGSTLTLEDFSFSTTAGTALHLSSATTIELSGDSTIEGVGTTMINSWGINSAAALTIQNKVGDTGTLTVKSGASSTSHSKGIACSGFTMNSGTVTATGSGTGSQNIGLDTSNGFSISGGMLTATGGGVASQTSAGIQVTAGIPSITGGTVIAASGTASMSSYALLIVDGEPSGAFTVKGGANSGESYDLVRHSGGKYVLASDGTTIAEYAKITAGNDATLYYSTADGLMHMGSLTGPVATANTHYTGSYTGSGTTLTLNGFVFSTSAATAVVVPTGVTINLTGASSITSMAAGGSVVGLDATGSLTISGNGSIDIATGDTTSGTSNALLVAGPLTITGGGVTAKAGKSNVSSVGALVYGAVNVSGGKLNTLGDDCTSSNGDTRGLLVSGQANKITVTGSGEIVAKCGTGGDPDLPPKAISTRVEPDAIAVGTVDGTVGSNAATYDATNFTYRIGSDIATYIKMTAKSSGGTAPTITTTSLANGTVGVAYSQTLAATGDATITWALDGGTALPVGLSLNTSTGVISGTPTAAGTTTFTVKATNSAGSATKQLSITVTADPAITKNLPLLVEPGASVPSITLEMDAVNYTSIQWYKDGVAIPGMNGKSYVIGKNAGAGDGEYYVVVSGNGKTVKSNTCTVRWSTTNAGTVIVDATPGPGVPNVSIADVEAFKNAALTDAEKAEVASDPTVTYTVTLNVTSAAGHGDVPAAEQKASSGGYTIGAHYEITVDKDKLVSGSPVGNPYPMAVTDLSGAVSIVVDIPTELQASGRTFAMVRVHNGTANVLADKDSSGSTITFASDRFSLYTLVYKSSTGGGSSSKSADSGSAAEEATTTTSPQTGDNSNMGLWVAVLTLAALGLIVGVVVWRRRKPDDRQEEKAG